MKYLGRLKGTGLVTGLEHDGQSVEYELDGYRNKMGQITGSGEIRMITGLIVRRRGQGRISLETRDGRTLGLHFTAAETSTPTTAAHVDIVTHLPGAAEWPH